MGSVYLSNYYWVKTHKDVCLYVLRTLMRPVNNNNNAYIWFICMLYVEVIMNNIQKIQKALENLSMEVELASLTGDVDTVRLLATVRYKLEGELFYAVNNESNVVYVDFSNKDEASVMKMDLAA